MLWIAAAEMTFAVGEHLDRLALQCKAPWLRVVRVRGERSAHDDVFGVGQASFAFLTPVAIRGRGWRARIPRKSDAASERCSGCQQAGAQEEVATRQARGSMSVHRHLRWSED